MRDLLKQAHLDDLIPQRTTADDAERSKPDSDIIVSALQKVGAAPSSAWMIGDTPYDIEAAQKAGVKTIAFLCGGWKAGDLSGAIAIYEGPWHLLEEWKKTPLAQQPH